MKVYDSFDNPMVRRGTTASSYLLQRFTTAPPLSGAGLSMTALDAGDPATDLPLVISGAIARGTNTDYGNGAATSANSLILHGYGEPGLPVVIYRQATGQQPEEIGRAAIDAAGHWTLDAFELLDAGEYTYTATTRLTEDEVGYDSNAFTIEVGSTDTLPPSVTRVGAGDIYSTEPDQWVDQSSAGYVRYYGKLTFEGFAEPGARIVVNNGSEQSSVVIADTEGFWRVEDVEPVALDSLMGDRGDDYIVEQLDVNDNVISRAPAFRLHPDVNAPALSRIEGAPAAGGIGADNLRIAFNEYMSMVTLNDFVLKRDGQVVAWNGDQELTSGDWYNYDLSGLESLTSQPGTYALYYSPQSDPATDCAGNEWAPGTGPVFRFVVEAGDVTPGQNDTIRVAASNGQISVFRNGTAIRQIDPGAVDQVFLAGLGGDDTFINELTPDMMPEQGIFFDGGDGTDAVEIHGTSGADAISFGEGVVTFPYDESDHSIFFDAEAVTLVSSAGADQIAVGDGEVTLTGSTLAAGSVMEIGGGTLKLPNHISNNGTITLSGGTLVFGNTVTLTNTGTIDVAAAGTLADAVSGGWGWIRNAGTISMSGEGTAVFPSAIAFTADDGATFDVADGGTLRIVAGIDQWPGDTLYKTGDGTLEISGAFSGRGIIQQSAGTVATGYTSLEGDYTLTAGSHLAGGSNTFIGAASGTATLTIGSGGLLSAYQVSIGSAGYHGAIVQNGGTVSAHNLLLGTPEYGPGAGTGDYTMNDGMLSLTGGINLGATGDGTFTHNGGTMTLSGRLNIGTPGSGTGIFYQHGGMVSVADTVDIGYQNTGAAAQLVQSGGSINSNGLRIGMSGGSGGVNLSGGSYVEDQYITCVGYGGTGTLNVSDTATLQTDSLWVGRGDVGGLGTSSSGSVSQSGGVVRAQGGLFIGYAGASGEYELSGGELTVSYLSGGVEVYTDVSNAGTFVQTGGTAQMGNLDGTGSTSVTDGSLTAHRVRQSALTIDGTGGVTIRGAGCGPGSTSATSVVGALSIGTDTLTGAPTGFLDLANNHLIVDYGSTSPFATLYDYVKSGYAAGAWTGTGIQSSAVANAALLCAVGIADNANLGLTSFGGQAVDATSILIRYTLAGDANLDGAVGYYEMVLVSNNWQMTGAHWSDGDFNYDGVVNGDDLAIMQWNYNCTLEDAEGQLRAGGEDASLQMAGDAGSGEVWTVLVDLRSKIAASEPASLASFDAWVAVQFGGADLGLLA